MTNAALPTLEYSIENKLLDSATDLLKNLQSKHSRLMVIRLDCSFKEEHQTAISFFDISYYLQRLWKNRRHNSMFEHCLGWIWRIEYAEDCQYHAHLLFIYNGHNVQSDVYYADLIGGYWSNRITDGEGSYYNCNRNKDNYAFCGLGTIDRNKDIEKFGHLVDYVLPYLAKESPLTREMMQHDAEALETSANGMRTFGCSY